MTESPLLYKATHYSLLFLTFKIHIFDIQLSTFMSPANGMSSFQAYKHIVVLNLQ